MYAKLAKKKNKINTLNPNVLVVLAVLFVCAVVYQFIVQNSQLGFLSLGRKDPASAATFTPGLQLYVATTGNDSNTGRSAALAFRSITRARDEIRSIKQAQGIPAGGIAVNIAAGTYENISVALDANDSGSATSPIVYRSTPGQTARLIGGKMIPASSLTGGTIKQVSLSTVGVTSTNPITARNSGYDGKAPTELFLDGKRMTMAQYPNAPNWAYTSGDPNIMTDGYTNYKCGESTFSCDTLSSLSGNGDLFIHAWSRDYASLYEPLSINPSTRTLSVSGPWIEMSGERRFRVLNARSLLDVAGEYFIDRGTNTLYFYPPVALSNQELYLSTNENVFKFTNASHIRLENLTMESSYGQLVDISLGSNIQVLGSTLRNSGENAILVQGGSNNLFQSNDMYDLGEGGVQLREETTSKTTAMNNSILNNHIYKFSQVQMSYRQGVKMVGVGNRAAYNKIHDTPNMAIWIQGSNNILEYNEVYDAVKESGDTAPFHTGLQSGTSGNEVRYNYFHDIDPNQFRKTRGQEPCEGTTGIYLDDNTSNFRVYGNIVYNPGNRGVFINNGNNNKIENNVFISSKYGVFLQYRYWTEPAPPKGNVIQNNANYGVEVALTPPNRSVECDNATWQPNMFTENTIQNANGGALLATDPGIVDPITKQLKNGTSASIQAALPGFQRIPIECIGIYNDEYRSDSNRNSTCGSVVLNPPTQPPTPTAIPTTPPTPTASPIGTGTLTPYRAVSIPGVLQAEEFDNGGKNVAYFDTTVGSQLQGVPFRQDTDVDIEALPVTLLVPGANTYSVSWVAAGEFLKYTFNVPTAGSYIVKPRVASAGLGGTYRLKIDNNAPFATLAVPDTTGWQSYVEQASAPVQISAGSHVLTVEMLTNGSQPNANPAVGNFDYFTFSAAAPANRLPVGTLTSVTSPTYNKVLVVSDSVIDPDVTLAPVTIKIYDNGTLVKTVLGNTLNETFSNVSAGTHSYKVTATDAQNGQEVELTGSPKSVIVQNPPVATGVPLVVNAAGSASPGVAMPVFDLRVNDVTIGTRTVTGQLANYTFTVPTNTKPTDVKVVYTNDLSTIVNGVRTDRDLRVDSITLNGTLYRSDAADTYSTGTWNSATGCSAGFKQSVWLHCGGYFQYKSAAAPLRIEAENFSATGGYWTVTGQETVPGVLKTATYIYRFDPRDWIKFSGITLTGKSKIDFNISPRTVGGTIEIRTGSSTGPLIGTLNTINADSTLTKYTVQSASLTATSGVQDLYLVSTNTYEVGRIDWIELK